MMLHRHFEEEKKRENMTTLADTTQKPETHSALLDSYEQKEDAPKRGRRKKED